MNDALNQKVVNVTPPAAINDNAAYVTKSIDTQGARYCTFEIVLGALDIAVAVLKLRHSDDDGNSDAYADVSGANYAVDSTVPAATEDNGIFAIHVDCRGKRRWLDLSFTAGDGSAGTFACVLARLSRLESLPKSAADRGYVRELFV